MSFLVGLIRLATVSATLAWLSVGAVSLAAIPKDAAQARDLLLRKFHASPDSILEIPLADVGAHPLGRRQASTVIVLFTDFGCGNCQAFHLTIFPKIESELVAPGKTLFLEMNYYHQDPSHAKAAFAAELQGKYAAMADQLYDTFERPSDQLYVGIAKANGLDVGAFLAALRSDAVAQAVDRERQQSYNLGVRTTPTFVIGWILGDGKIVGQRMVGSRRWTFIRDRIEQMLDVP